MDYVPYVDSNDNYGTNANDEILQKLEKDVFVVCTMMMVDGNNHNMFDPNELEEGDQRIVDHKLGSYKCS
jgi:hypothetical protein